MQERIQPQGATRERVMLAAAGAAALLAGLFFYLLCRTQPPPLLAPISAPLHAPLLPVAGSWPSFLHAFAFTALLAACFPATRRRVWACALLWIAANALWECGGAALAHTTTALAQMLPTGDPFDILFAAVGACLPVLITNSKNQPTTPWNAEY